jgi:hypothetical protein
MTARRNTPRPGRREIFVLTPEEKKTVCFVLLVFFLGLTTKHYRDNRPAAVPKPIVIARERATRKPPPISRH